MMEQKDLPYWEEFFGCKFTRVPGALVGGEMHGPLWEAIVPFTGAMGQRLLECHNENNRPLSESHARRLADAILKEHWLLTGIPLLIGWDHKGIDLQHRCRAIVIADGRCPGIAVPMKVCIGVNPAVFPLIDRQRHRNLIDVASIRAVAEPRYAAPALAIIRNFFLGRGLTRLGGPKVHLYEQLDELLLYAGRGLAASAQRIRAVGNRHRMLGGRAMSVALDYILHLADAEIAGPFLQMLLAYDVPSDTESWQSCRWLFEALTDLLGHHPAPEVVAGMTIRAWNATKDRKHLRKRPTFRPAEEEFPVVRGFIYQAGKPIMPQAEEQAA